MIILLKFRFIEDKGKHFYRYARADDIESGQALFTPLKLRSEGLVPASATRGADADFHSNLPRRRDSSSSCPLRSPEVKETLQGPRTPTPQATAQKIPARPATASSGSCAAYG